MATYTFPTQLAKDGLTTTARSARELWNLVYDGWKPVGSPVPVDDNDGFSDASLAALIMNPSSQTYAALMTRFISNQKLILSQTPPTAPADGTVWIDTSP